MRRSFQNVLGFVAIFVVGGCGPLTFPAVQRLDAVDQERIEQLWSNLLASPEHRDRQAFLDAIAMYQLHEQGVDRLVMRSEKDLSDGVAVMHVSYDRANPDDDRFVVEIFDDRWNLQRRESFTHEEVIRTIEELSLVFEDEPVDAQEFDDAARRARRQRLESIGPPDRGNDDED